MHPDSSFSIAKLEAYRKIGTPGLIDSLKPGEPCSLKVQPDGTFMDGHHRIHILHERGIEVDAAFQIIEKARKRPVPDTIEQRTWVEQYATGMEIAGSLKVAEKAEPYKTEFNKSAGQVESVGINDSEDSQ